MLFVNKKLLNTYISLIIVQNIINFYNLLALFSNLDDLKGEPEYLHYKYKEVIINYNGIDKLIAIST